MARRAAVRQRSWPATRSSRAARGAAPGGPADPGIATAVGGGEGRCQLTVLETDRLRLRELSAADDPGFVLHLLNDEAFIRYIGDRGVRTLEDAERYILDGPVDSYTRNGFGLYCVELIETGDPIGICGLVKRPALADPDIGFAFLPEFRAHGYALEAARAALEHARHDLRLRRILAIVSPDNERSERLLLKLGMRYECRIRITDEKTPLKLFVSDT